MNEEKDKPKIQITEKNEQLLAVNRAKGECKNITGCIDIMRNYYKKDQLDFDFFELEKRIGELARELTQLIEETEDSIRKFQEQEVQAEHDKLLNEMILNKKIPKMQPAKSKQSKAPRSKKKAKSKQKRKKSSDSDSDSD